MSVWPTMKLPLVASALVSSPEFAVLVVPAAPSG